MWKGNISTGTQSGTPSMTPSAPQEEGRKFPGEGIVKGAVISLEKVIFCYQRQGVGMDVQAGRAEAPFLQNPPEVVALPPQWPEQQTN